MPDSQIKFTTEWEVGCNSESAWMEYESPELTEIVIRDSAQMRKLLIEDLEKYIKAYTSAMKIINTYEKEKRTVPFALHGDYLEDK